MCGILGYFNKEGISETLPLFPQALNKMIHRGPDGGAVWNDEQVIFGHRRLSIIDLSNEANQPFISNSGKAVIVFNGEIYNYKEISKGLVLRTTSDTEVIIEGYLQYGIKFFKELRGIYSFVIYDFRNEADKKLILLRDSAGIKPMYLFLNGSTFIFSSEIKSMLPLLKAKPAINVQALKTYIHLGYILEPDTIYEGIKAITPGLVYQYHFNTSEWENSVNRTYDFDKENKKSVEVNLKETEAALMLATKRNLVADVEVNVALSGGIDSSLIYAYANKVMPVRGITVQMHEKAVDESETAKIYADHLKAPHQIVTTQVENRLDLLNKLLLHFDQPYADSSFLPFYFLTSTASKYSKVLIGGDSGDEIHNGYSGYKFLPLFLSVRGNSVLRSFLNFLIYFGKILFKKKDRFLKKVHNLINSKNNPAALFEWHAWFPISKKSYPVYPFKYNTGEIHKVFDADKRYKRINTLIKENYFNKRMISDYLRKSDMMSMYNSIEFRVPMLDEDFVDKSLEIPYYQKSKLFKGQKLILRKLHSFIYPDFTSKLKKQGFTIPLDSWLGDDNLNLIKDNLKRKDGIVKDYIVNDYIDILFDTLKDTNLQRYCSRESAYQRILILYSLQLWYFEIYNLGKEI